MGTDRRPLQSRPPARWLPAVSPPRMNWFQFNLQDFAFSFLGVLFESIPFLLLGAMVSGLIEVFVPARLMTRLLPKNPAGAVALAGLLGVIFPMCECGVVPIIRRLMGKGLPVACAVTYLLAAPVVNPIVAVSTFAAFNGQRPWVVVGFRLALSYAVAVLVGLLAHRLRPEEFLQPQVLETLPGRAGRRTAFRVGALAGGGGSLVAPFTGEAATDPRGEPASLAELEAVEAELRPTLARRLLLALNRGAEDFLDVAVFVVIGAALASVFNTAIRQEAIRPLATNPWAATGVLMALAFFIAVCSTSDAFIAAALGRDFKLYAKLGFLVFGPMFDLKLVLLYSLVFRRRFVLWLGVGLFALIGLVCVRLSVLNL